MARRASTKRPRRSPNPARQRPTSARHRRFVAEYLVDGNATQAAIRAGYSAKTARVQGPRLLSNAAIADTIAGRQQRTAAKLDVTREQIAAELIAIGFTRVAPDRISGADKRAALVDLAKLLGFWQERHQLDAGGVLLKLLAAVEGQE